MSRSQTIGLVGWKCFEPAEWDDAPGLFVPHYLVRMLSRIASGSRADDCWRLYDGGGQQKSPRGGGLTGGLIQFREICVNSVD